MKISIITVCFNSEATITDTINSVNSQSYKNIEHIFVDGGSKDRTLAIIKNNPNKKKKIIVKKGSSIYEAMNIGIKKATGSIIQILNSDDILYSNIVIEQVISKIKKFPNFDMYLGNVVFFSYNNFYKVKRYFTADKKKINNLINGDMPPHPASFIKKDVYKNCGLYDTNYEIASDFDFFFRTIFINKKRYKLLNNEIVRMRSGGASDKNIKSYFKTTKEILNSLKKYNIKKNSIKIMIRGIHKIGELFKFNQDKLNKKFKLFKFNYMIENYQKNSFKILNSLKNLNLKSNFILSGMNLAFLGYYSKKYLYPHKDLYHWPDGIFTKRIINIKKIPGRDIIRDMKIPKKIKKINVVGNISKISLSYLKRKFKTQIININLPYAPIQKLVKNNIKLKKNEITFITLPTPKQEQLAYELAKKNTFFKIICIGGSIAIASGEEKPVPKLLQDYEFLWRLKSDSFRRIIRLFDSLFFYIKGHYIHNLYNKTIFKIIEK